LELKWRSLSRETLLLFLSSQRGKINPNQWSRLMGEAFMKQTNRKIKGHLLVKQDLGQ
jgi:hypothetical protein